MLLNRLTGTKVLSDFCEIARYKPLFVVLSGRFRMLLNRLTGTKVLSDFGEITRYKPFANAS